MRVICSFLGWCVLPETFCKIMSVVVHCQPYFSGCRMNRHSCLMLLRSRVWQIMLHEPKLPRINLVVILTAENTNNVVFGTDSYCTEWLSLGKKLMLLYDLFKFKIWVCCIQLAFGGQYLHFTLEANSVIVLFPRVSVIMVRATLLLCF